MNIKKLLAVGIILLFTGMALAPSITASEPTSNQTVYSDNDGTLSGYVKDTSMNPIEGARVRVYFHETYEENYSDSSGYYHVTNIPICNCTKNATASKDGYTTEWVLLTIWENTTLDFVLTPLGKTLYVGGTGPGNYSKIQDAIDNATDEGTIYVYNGTYYENIVIDKTIDLVGEDRNTTIIDGGDSGDVVYVTADWVNISGFTIQNSGSVYLQDAGIDVRSHFSNFSGNIISNNRYGIYLNDSSSNTVTGNIITYNADGILLCGFSNIVLSNTISNNWYGIYLDDSSSNVILKNNFHGNKQHAFFENCTNIWEHNYWNRPRLLPKLIFGVIEIDSRWILWVNIDWHPALKPYDIPL